jgi:hypothetical protein
LAPNSTDPAEIEALMLAVNGGCNVLLSTQFGNSGFFYKEWSEGGEDWRKVKITADCPAFLVNGLKLSARPFEWIR